MLIVLFLTLFCSVVFRTAYCDVAIVAPEPNSVYDLSGTSQAVVKVKWMHTDNTPQERILSDTRLLCVRVPMP